MLTTGESALFRAVIEAAMSDAKKKRKCLDREHARMFLTGANKEWREHLELCCSIAGLEVDYVIRKAKELIGEMQ